MSKRISHYDDELAWQVVGAFEGSNCLSAIITSDYHDGLKKGTKIELSYEYANQEECFNLSVETRNSKGRSVMCDCFIEEKSGSALRDAITFLKDYVEFT